MIFDYYQLPEDPKVPMNLWGKFVSITFAMKFFSSPIELFGKLMMCTSNIDFRNFLSRFNFKGEVYFITCMHSKTVIEFTNWDDLNLYNRFLNQSR